MSESLEITEKSILLDSCIVNHALSQHKDLALKTSGLLEELLKRNNALYLSKYSHYEILRSLDDPKKAKALNFLQSLIIVPTSDVRIERATRLYDAYSGHASIRERLGSISDIDIFLGAHLFTKHSPLLLTTDFNDYPRPFFDTVRRIRIEYEKGKGTSVSSYFYFLRANLEALSF